MGTTEDVIALPEVLEVLEEFERENRKNLNISMTLPPLESLEPVKPKKTPGRPKKNVEKDMFAKKVKEEVDDSGVDSYGFDSTINVRFQILIKHHAQKFLEYHECFEYDDGQ